MQFRNSQIEEMHRTRYEEGETYTPSLGMPPSQHFDVFSNPEAL